MDQKKRRQLIGVIVSTKMQKTVVVEVPTLKTHPKYQKKYLVSRKFKAHDPFGYWKEGDKVVIEETKPISKDKCWRVLPKAEITQ